LCPRDSHGRETSVHLRHALLSLALLNHIPPPPERLLRQQENESLFAREGHQLLCQRLGGLRLSSSPMELGDRLKNGGQAESVSQRAGEGQRLLTALPGLVQISQREQDTRQQREVGHPGILHEV